jgi:tetratricopeptide (TPR) repeat protein
MRSEETRRAEAAFEDLRNCGVRAIERGELEEAAESFAAALRLAREQGELKRIDLALSNWAAAVIELGRGDGEISRLREVLLRNSDPVNCRMAAYDIARYYELKKNYKKALFYARITRDRSEALGRRDWIASSHNLIGNTLLAESFVEEACVEYERALELMPVEPSPARGQILDNLGYCRILQGRFGEGYRLLYESLRLLRRFGARRHEISVRLDLCFAHLETGRYRHSRRQGEAALAIAESLGDQAAAKNALYLLGEVAHLNGDGGTARDYFARLQRDFFPEAGYLPEFLLAVDIRRLVNLHA